MNERIAGLRERSFEAKPRISIERALIITAFYKENAGKYSVPVLRAMAFRELCEKKTIYIGDGELIVAERGPAPKAVSTFPELTCHSSEDLRILNSRPMTSYSIGDEDIERYARDVEPYWRGRCVRDRAFSDMPSEWSDLYEAGVFTEFMEQRAAGHTALDGAIYRKGLEEYRAEIAEARAEIDWGIDPEAYDKDQELIAMDIACDAAILFARRHARLAESMAAKESDPVRRDELLEIAAICDKVPARAPETFHEAVQTYWFTHLATITELNGWDAMSPGHFDRHLEPFYRRDLAAGKIDAERAKELLACFCIKVNNTPAPPKVGVTAAESGTYNDFTQISLGGLTSGGEDASGTVSALLLQTLDELHLLQPQPSVHVATKTAQPFLRLAAEVSRKGAGYPSFFNADLIVREQLRAGKSIEDAREGGTSGCVETGCFGKEAYILHGYLNVPKVLELALNDGVDPLSGKRVGPATGQAISFRDFETLYAAFETQLRHAVDWKVRVDNKLARIYAENVPAPYLSVMVADCVANGRDYYNGGARYNTDYIQCCGIGTVTDSLSVIKKMVYDEASLSMAELLAALAADWQGHDELRERIQNSVPFFGNDDDAADDIMKRVFASELAAIEGKRSTRGQTYRVNMLSTTCHIYFGKKLGATPNGRRAHLPESDGTSPSHGADRHGPTAVMKSLSKMDQAKTSGTLLNQRFLPSTLAGERGVDALSALVRGYFALGGHHVQFNVVDTATLRKAQESPGEYRNLLVRVAGYSDYFVDLDLHHQEEIIARTAQEKI
ncbi:MAG TPA: trans-4-hydroxy-L-proline dehydratase [Rectinemataceae bacterium]|nr:trans-4-hydroxy-L-proline dehydratase [Rectinemataceae bacterium]